MKEKYEDHLKREIKKLQRQRDQIKTWAASNDIKDKKPLQEQRRLIETEMEKFKAVEKEMKTKAFSKEGLQQASKQDPKEREKQEAADFLTDQISELDRQIETLEAEDEALNSQTKKSKKDTGKQDRLSEIGRLIERHKWHQSQLELANRALENGSVEPEQINAIKEDIKYYVDENQGVDFMEDEEIYDPLGLDEEGGAWGISADVERTSSHDDKSTQQDDSAIDDTKSGKAKSVAGSDAPAPSARRPSNQFKSPLPALATLHAPSASVSTTAASSSMKPAPVPTRPPGETLQYASAAKVAAASEKTIAPLPPAPTAPSISALPPAPGSQPASVASPVPAVTAPVHPSAQPAPKSAQQPLAAASVPPTPTLETSETSTPPPKSKSPLHVLQKAPTQSTSTASPELEQPRTPGPEDSQSGPRIESEVESIYHLPPGFQELIQSFETTRSMPSDPTSDYVRSMLEASSSNLPDAYDTEKPRVYKPAQKYAIPSFYPSMPVTIVDDPNLFSRIDTDTLFFLFYYRQATYLQYQAAKALKAQSWRFHKQYQTWFQRHEEPKMISDEFEQGTYRFFDYESTW